MLEVTTSIHGMPCIEVLDSTPEVRQIIRSAVTGRFSVNDPRFEMKENAGPFLQGDDGKWILVEFWQKDYQPFVDYLNERIEEGQ